jgi:hypothetical protein
MKITIYSDNCIRCGTNARHRKEIVRWAKDNRVIVEERRTRYDPNSRDEYIEIVSNAGIKPMTPVVYSDGKTVILSEAINVLPSWL